MDALKKYRQKLDMTQAQLADFLGVSQPFINQLETGARSLSPEKAMEFERITKGALPRWATRPDLWSPEKRAAR